MDSMHSDPLLCILENVYSCFSQVFTYKHLFQCLQILEMTLKLEVRMSFKI